VTLHTVAFSRKYENLYLDTLEASVCIKSGRLLFTHNPSNLERKTEICNSNSAVNSLPYLDGVCEVDHHARVAHDDLLCTDIFGRWIKLGTALSGFSNCEARIQSFKVSESYLNAKVIGG